jgi:hypothetical protein
MKMSLINQVYVKTALVVSVSQISDKQLRYNLVKDLTISNQGFNVVFSNASPVWRVRYLDVMISVF